MLQPVVLRSDVFQSKRFSGVGILVFLICIVAGAGVTVQTGSRAGLLSGVLAGAYFLLAIKVVDQWERVAVLRFGRFRAMKPPGVFLIIPIVDTLSRYVDQRVRVTTVSAESTLTRDTVPVNVDAIVFWLVWNAEKAIFEVDICCGSGESRLQVPEVIERRRLALSTALFLQRRNGHPPDQLNWRSCTRCSLKLHQSLRRSSRDAGFEYCEDRAAQEN